LDAAVLHSGVPGREYLQVNGPSVDGRMESAHADNARSGVRAAEIPIVRKASFEEIYEQWLPEVARWARAMGARHAELEDVCQEVFLVVRRRLSDFDGGNVAGWLYRITQRMVRSERRKAWVRRTLFLGSEEWNSLESSRSHVAEELERAEDVALLEQLLERLAMPKRTAFVLHEIEGKSGEAIAALEGVPVGTIYSRLHHAKRELASMIEKRRNGRR
jgi:RNA polymerase sigma-70 factor (ECF subfamily)